MGKGKSGAGGGGVSSLDLANGDKIDLTDSPLKYGQKDPMLTGAARQMAEQFEDKRYKNKIEYNRMIDKNGNIIEENKECSTTCKKLANDVRAGKLNYKNYAQKHTAAVNKYLVDMHNFLLDNQSKYGYVYTLEGRS